MDDPCKNCGFNEYELVDGHYYCIECHEEVEDSVKKVHDEYEHENVVFDKVGIKKKDIKKEEEKTRAALDSRLTSFEEYNYILRGLVDEILLIENIPKFKTTVLQLWITYLRFTEVAFVDERAHLPKLHAYYRKEDAEILYNKKPIKRKRARAKKKIKTEISGNSLEMKRMRKRSSRRSLKKIQKLNEESESFISDSSQASTLSNLTIEDVQATVLGKELTIEFSEVAKKIKRKQIKYAAARDMKCKVSDYDDSALNIIKGDVGGQVLLLSGKTLIFIIYCALNICGSSIQLSDLLRLAKEGHISYYSFLKLLPESLHDTKLSLTKYHTMTYLKHTTCLSYLFFFLNHFPDIRQSLRVPNLVMLVRRYISDLNLPTCLNDYVEKLMELMPSKLKYVKFIPNYEGRAMGYMLFVIKLLFGIDGYREKEMSKAAKEVNLKLKTLNIPQRLFNYEAWREYIEYREVILNKYYYPSIFNGNNKLAYTNYLKMINTVKPVSFEHFQNNDKITKGQREKIERSAAIKEMMGGFMDLHVDDPAEDITFEHSFTPHKDALSKILEISHGATINKDILTDFSNDSLEFYFEPEKLKNLFSEHQVQLSMKPSTVPKVFSFQKSTNFLKKYCEGNVNMEVCHETVPERLWLKNQKEQHEMNLKVELDKKVNYHHNKMAKLLKERFKLRKSINFLKYGRNSIKNPINFDEIVDIADDEQSHDGGLTFVHPDFNLWHADIRYCPWTVPKSKEDVDRLPKSMLWLLDAASRTTNQERELIYFHLNVLEMEFLETYHPLELTDNQLEFKVDEKSTIKKSMHKFW